MAEGVDSGYIDPWCDPCANDGKYAAVVSYCPLCVEFFCKQCSLCHSNCQRTKSHKVKLGTDMPSCQAEKPPKYEECSIHPGGLKEYFCVGHCTMICQGCQNDHTMCLVKHATVMSKTLNNKDINTLENEVTDAKKEASNEKYFLEYYMKSVEEKRKSMLNVVEEEYNKMKRLIAARVNSVTEEINKTCDEKVSSLTNLMKGFSDGLAEYDSALDIIQVGARTKLDTKLFLKLQSLLNNIRHKNTSLHETRQAIETSYLKFDVDKRWTSLLSCCPKIGKVQITRSPAIQLCNIEFPPIDPIEAKPVREKNVFADSLYQDWTLMFGAFDVGNQFSTYCYGFTYRLNRMDLRAEKYKDTDEFWKLKIPMTALIAPDKETLVAFGYKAENKYEEFIQDDKHKDYYYFPHFGINLREEFKKTDLENLTITDSTGKAIPAKTLYVLAVKFFYDDLLSKMQKTVPLLEFTGEDVSWAIIVPSFWTEAAKRFMMEAAEEAGILATHVCIVTEAQAAATFCRKVLTVGKYLILDVGDQDSQITEDTFTPPGFPKFLRISSFRGVGGRLLDVALNKLFAGILGNDVFQRFVETKPDEWLDMITCFKAKIANLTNSLTCSNKVTIRNSADLVDLYTEMKGKTLKEAIAISKFSADVTIFNNNIRIGSHVMESLSDVPANIIIRLLETALWNMRDEQITTIFITGEFTKGSYLQNIIRRKFADISFVFPTESETVVSLGAAMHVQGNT